MSYRPIFDSAITSRIAIDAVTGCWLWTGSRDLNGYGQMNRRGRLFRVHRFVFEGLHGVLPFGIELDHLCRSRACCNPEHLEPVTGTENKRRSRRPLAKCGHPCTSETRNGCQHSARRCAICRAVNVREAKERRNVVV